MEELIHRDIVRCRLNKLEDKKELNAICGAFADSLNKLREDVRKSNRRVATLEESNMILRNVLFNATAECPRSQPTIPNNRKGLFDPPSLVFQARRIFNTL